MEQSQLKEQILTKAMENINNDIDLDSFNANEGKELLTKLFNIPEVHILENATEDRTTLTNQYIRLIATFTCSDGGSKSDYYGSALANAFKNYGLELPTNATGEFGEFVKYISTSITNNALRVSEELALHQKLSQSLGK